MRARVQNRETRHARLRDLCCATELAAEPGDFGRPRESVFVDEVLPWLKDGFEPFTGLRAGAPYTDDERTLRDLAYAILQPPEWSDRHFIIAGADFFDLWDRWIVGPPPFDVQSYAAHLIAKPYRSSSALYALEDRLRRMTSPVPLAAGGLISK